MNKKRNYAWHIEPWASKNQIVVQRAVGKYGYELSENTFVFNPGSEDSIERAIAGARLEADRKQVLAEKQMELQKELLSRRTVALRGRLPVVKYVFAT